VAELLRAERQGTVLRLTLQNPPANVLSVEVMGSLQAGLDSARDDRDVRVVVLAAGKLFSAGHDLKEMTSHRADADGGKDFFARTFALCSRLMQSIVEHPKPIIAESTA
jgi:enoyl-CoA hydratase/carnithine racemase